MGVITGMQDCKVNGQKASQGAARFLVEACLQRAAVCKIYMNCMDKFSLLNPEQAGGA